MADDSVELTGRTYQSNEVRLFTDGKEICAMIGPDPFAGISGTGFRFMMRHATSRTSL